MMQQTETAGVRLAEVVAMLSLATDLGAGFTYEHGLRSCLLALELARAFGLGEDACAEVYYLALLRYAGCTADQQWSVALLGDEIAIAKHIVTADYTNMNVMLGIMARHVGEDLPPLRRIQTVLGALTNGMRLGPQDLANHQRAHCEAAQITAERLGVGPGVRAALGQAFEYWGGGGPLGLRGEAIALTVRIVQLAENVFDFFQLGGQAAAETMARQRAGTLLDPAVCACFCDAAPAILACLETESSWEAVLAAEPGPAQALTGDRLDAAARAIADFADLKSFYTVGHSAGVAGLATAAAQACHLSEAEIALVRRAALVHDLGRVGVSLRVWDKPGALTRTEWEQVRLHPYYTERVLARSAALAPIGALAALHHERLDGSGYHKGLPASLLPPAARILAAADAYHAMTEPRPHRPALSAEAAAGTLRQGARSGLFDIEAANAVLAAAGHRVRSTRRSHPSGLSEREVAVLRLVSRGLSNKQMAARLNITDKTVSHHVQHIYDKIGVSTRAAATLFAMQHDLIAEAGELAAAG
ncbi:MAG TPA: HD domain-containing phosphohydrolase [Thermomicrobiales bacterium]|nr:HD domain-containing phosphohydrolase [Thermomicrobiales bacterium]